MRIHSIDYLRGAMALSILLYHFFSWSIGGQSSDTVLGRLGIYGVSTFYVISGMSMFIACRNYAWSPKETWSYLVKRFFRIAPLFAIATLTTIVVLRFINPQYFPTLETLISNLTLAFGFYNPTNYIVTGGWSIGNEMVFYFFLPMAVILFRSPAMAAWVLAGVLGLYAYYAFFVMSGAASIAAAWSDYVHPANQGFLFLAGVTLGKLFIDGYRLRTQSAAGILLLAIAAFCFYPATGNQISIVSGFSRIAFTAMAIAAVYSVACLSINEASIAHKVMAKLGEISYSIYMLHGAIGLAALRLVAPKFGLTTADEKFYLLMLGALPLTLVASLFVYTYIETPFVRLARRLTTRTKQAFPAAA